MKQKKQKKSRLDMIMMLFTVIFLCAHASFAVEILTLDRALDIALDNSPEIKRTELLLLQRTETLNAREASLKSNFSLSLNPFSYSSRRTFNDLFSLWNTNETTGSSGTFRITQPIKETDGTLSLINTLSWQENFSEFQDTRTKTFDNNMYIRYDQPIFTYNQTKLELSELELDIENAGYNYALQKLGLEQNVTQSFYNVYQTKKNLEISLSDLENSEKNYLIQKNKVEAGLLPTEEIYQAEVTRASSQLTVQNNRETLENALDTFKLQLGISIYDSIDVDTDITHKAIEVDLDKALNNGLKTRMELRQAEMNIQEALNNVTRAAATNEFSGNVTFSYGLIGTDENIENVYDTPTNSGTVNLSLTVPLWDWGEKTARMKVANAGVESSQLSLEDERNRVIVAIRSAYRNLDNLVSQIDIERLRVRNAQLTYEINSERYKNGDITSMDLFLIQDQLTSAKQSEVQSLINYKLALLEMKILSLWDFVDNVPIIPENIIKR